MILIGEKEEKGWVHANYRLTRPVSWQQLLKAVHGVYGYFKKTEILVNGLPIQIGQPEEILQTPESKAISIRGVLTIIDVPRGGNLLQPGRLRKCYGCRRKRRIPKH